MGCMYLHLPHVDRRTGVEEEQRARRVTVLTRRHERRCCACGKGATQPCGISGVRWVGGRAGIGGSVPKTSRKLPGSVMEASRKEPVVWWGMGAVTAESSVRAVREE